MGLNKFHCVGCDSTRFISDGRLSCHGCYNTICSWCCNRYKMTIVDEKEEQKLRGCPICDGIVVTTDVLLYEALYQLGKSKDELISEIKNARTFVNNV